MGVARFELVTREGCHLCDVMAELLDRVLPAMGESWVPVDVDAEGNEALRERYGEVVPVLLREGKAAAKVRVDERQLRRIVLGRR